MADVKISALPLASTPLAGTEVLPIVQSATTDQVSVANLTAGRAVSAASLTLTTTPLAFGSGGTGATAFTANYIPYSNGTSLTSSANLVFDGTNLGVGTSNPSLYGKLAVANTSAGTVTAGAILVNNSANSVGSGVGLYFDPNGAQLARAASIQSVQTTSGNFANLQFFVAGGGTPVQAMTLDTSGNLGLGTTNTTRTYANYNLLTINGSSGAHIKLNTSDVEKASFVADSNALYVTSATKINFGIGTGAPSASMVLDASGNLQVGTTSQLYSGKQSISFSSNTGRGLTIYDTAIQNNATFIAFLSATSTAIGSITANGTTAVLYNTTSDISLKQNIIYADSSLASILALPIRQFDWKSDGSHADYGVVAQEAFEHAPEMVTQGDIWSVDYGRITPRLIKAFQELAAKVQALEAKVA